MPPNAHPVVARLLALFAILLPGTAMSQDSSAQAPATPPPAAPATAPCTAAPHRAFDFWVGEWEVFGGDRQLGTNTITRIEGGCGLAEHWRGAGGITGVSYNAYDPVDGKWHQLWIGSDGTVLQLAGGPRDGAMVMEGLMPDASGSPQPQRITWTPAADGSVRQHWEARDAAGAWTTAFDGTYRRRAGSAAD